MPAFVQSLQNDPCLVPYPARQPIPPQCQAKWPTKCNVIDCADGQPLSRLVAPIPGGSCNWMDECQTDADCVLATNYAVQSCCACSYAYPKALLATNQCLLQSCPPSQPCPPPFCPPQWECGMPCGCPAASPPVCQKAAPGDPKAKNRCLPWSSW